MKTAVCTTLALVAASASAFVVPSANGPQSATTTGLRAEAEKTELLVDENFDEVNLVGLMGLNRLKKISRRHQRQLNDRIRNFEVVQDGEDYVPATAEQTEQMRAAAGAAAAAPVADTSSTVGKAIADPLKIIIAGAPASGKGTQCEIIKDKYGLVHLSTGDMLRAAVADQTEVGLLAKEYMDAGRLVPDDVIVKLVSDRINQPDCTERGYLLDGFPRTRKQALALKTMGVEPDTFLFIDVPDDALVERIVGRRLDPVDGSIYHLKFRPPPEEIMGRLITRSDDTEENARSRLNQFHSNVNAIKSIFRDVMVVVDGRGSPGAVAKQIGNALERKPTKCTA